MSVYRVTFHVASAALTTLLDTVKNTDGIRLANVTDLADPEPLPKAPPPPARAPVVTEAAPRVVVGKRVTGDVVVLGVLGSGPATWGELKRAFVNHNFAAASVGQYVTRLLKTGHIQREGSGRYALSNINGRGAGGA